MLENIMRHKAITWTNVDQVLWYDMKSWKSMTWGQKVKANDNLLSWPCMVKPYGWQFIHLWESFSTQGRF